MKPSISTSVDTPTERRARFRGRAETGNDMNDTAGIQVRVQARGATATFMIDINDPNDLRQFACFALSQALHGDVVTVEAIIEDC